MKKKHLLWLLCAMFLLGTAACSNEKSDDDVTNVSKDQIQKIPAVGGTYTSVLTTSGDWTAFASNNESWISISPTNGKSGDTITIKVAPNDTGSDREGTVAITIGFSRQYITFHQSSK